MVLKYFAPLQRSVGENTPTTERSGENIAESIQNLEQKNTRLEKNIQYETRKRQNFQKEADKFKQQSDDYTKTIEQLSSGIDELHSQETRVNLGIFDLNRTIRTSYEVVNERMRVMHEAQNRYETLKNSPIVPEFFLGPWLDKYLEAKKQWQHAENTLKEQQGRRGELQKELKSVQGEIQSKEQAKQKQEEELKHSEEMQKNHAQNAEQATMRIQNLTRQQGRLAQQLDSLKQEERKQQETQQQAREMGSVGRDISNMSQEEAIEYFMTRFKENLQSPASQQLLKRAQGILGLDNKSNDEASALNFMANRYYLIEMLHGKQISLNELKNNTDLQKAIILFANDDDFEQYISQSRRGNIDDQMIQVLQNFVNHTPKFHFTIGPDGEKQASPAPDNMNKGNTSNGHSKETEGRTSGTSGVSDTKIPTNIPPEQPHHPPLQSDEVHAGKGQSESDVSKINDENQGETREKPDDNSNSLYNLTWGQSISHTGFAVSDGIAPSLGLRVGSGVGLGKPENHSLKMGPDVSKAIEDAEKNIDTFIQQLHEIGIRNIQDLDSVLSGEEKVVIQRLLSRTGNKNENHEGGKNSNDAGKEDDSQEANMPNTHAENSENLERRNLQSLKDVKLLETVLCRVVLRDFYYTLKDRNWTNSHFNDAQLQVFMGFLENQGIEQTEIPGGKDVSHESLSEGSPQNVGQEHAEITVPSGSQVSSSKNISEGNTIKNAPFPESGEGNTSGVPSTSIQKSGTEQKPWSMEEFRRNSADIYEKIKNAQNLSFHGTIEQLRSSLLINSDTPGGRLMHVTNKISHITNDLNKTKTNIEQQIKREQKINAPWSLTNPSNNDSYYRNWDPIYNNISFNSSKKQIKRNSNSLLDDTASLFALKTVKMADGSTIRVMTDVKDMIGQWHILQALKNGESISLSHILHRHIKDENGNQKDFEASLKIIGTKSGIGEVAFSFLGQEFPMQKDHAKPEYLDVFADMSVNPLFKRILMGGNETSLKYFEDRFRAKYPTEKIGENQNKYYQVFLEEMANISGNPILKPENIEDVPRILQQLNDPTFYGPIEAGMREKRIIDQAGRITEVSIRPHLRHNTAQNNDIARDDVDASSKTPEIREEPSKSSL